MADKTELMAYLAAVKENIGRQHDEGWAWCAQVIDAAITEINRPAPENKPLTLDELRKMDGEPVYAQAGDGTEGWAIVFWNSPETLFLYGPEFDSIFEPDLDFINMTYNDPDGHFGLHIFGWRALRHKPDAETECKKK